MSAAVSGLGTVIGTSIVANRPVIIGSLALVPVSGITCNVTANNDSFTAGSRSNLFNNNDNTNIAISPVTFVIVGNDSIGVMPVCGRLAALRGTVGVTPRVVSGTGRVFAGSGRSGHWIVAWTLFW